MDKHRKIDSQDLINPDFATSTYYGGHSLTEDELLSRLRSDYTIYRKFAKYGYIISIMVLKRQLKKVKLQRCVK